MHLANKNAYCHECLKLDFLQIFSEADKVFGIRKKRELDTAGAHFWRNSRLFVHSFGERLSQPSQCPLCQFFRVMRVEPDNHSTYHLVAYSSVTSNYLIPHYPDIAYYGWDVWQRVGRLAYLAVVPQATDDDMVDKVRKTGAIYRSLPTLEHKRPKSCIWGREIHQMADFTIAKEWLNFCLTHHKNRCTSRMLSDWKVKGLRFLDCTRKPLTIKEPKQAKRYVALSYVWGSRQTEAWPKVVLDAASVTQKLGLRYLWVDRYCIDQSNLEEKHYLISRMASIYEGAEITIVAAAGSDATFGLPGVESVPRIMQPKIQVHGLNAPLVSSLPDPWHIIQTSIWNGRGWTYQEGVLSKRLLVFTAHQLYWECKGMTLQESLIFPASVFHNHAQRSLLSRFGTRRSLYMGRYMRPGMFIGNLGEESTAIISNSSHHTMQMEILRQLDHHIEEFTKRALSFETDSLLAFQGILQKFLGDRKGSPQQILGLPVLVGLGDVADPKLGTSVFQHSLALSISSWTHEDKYRGSHSTFFACRMRLTHLPSWTWAGWKGSVSWMTKNSRAHFEVMEWLLQARPDIVWSPRMALASTHWKTTEGLRRHLNDPQLKCCLTIVQPYVLSQLQFNQRPELGWICGRWSLSISLSIHMTISELASSHQSGYLMSILMFITTSPMLHPAPWLAWFIVIRELQDSDGAQRWERVGRLHFHGHDNDIQRCRTRKAVMEELPVRRFNGVITIT
jgi:hypothetical protein